jgi:hypothetical protein
MGAVTDDGQERALRFDRDPIEKDRNNELDNLPYGIRHRDVRLRLQQR